MDDPTLDRVVSRNLPYGPGIGGVVSIPVAPVCRYTSGNSGHEPSDDLCAAETVET